MATDHLTVRSPLQRRELWDFLPFRALLLGTTDQSSVLSLLPEGHSLLNVILSPVVLHYEDEVPGMILVRAVCANRKHRVCRPTRSICMRGQNKVP